MIPLDVTKPNIARMYDYWLGGKDNFEATGKPPRPSGNGAPTWRSRRWTTSGSRPVIKRSIVLRTVIPR